MFEIDIKKITSDKKSGVFAIEVVEKDGSSNHKVTLDTHYYELLTEGNITPERLLELSFEFLLEREPKESILAEFNLKKISHYFPEYESKIQESI